MIEALKEPVSIVQADFAPVRMVSEEWVDAWLDANVLFPQVNIGNNNCVGQSIVDSIIRGKAGWVDVASSQLNDIQLNRVKDRLQRAHKAYCVTKFTDEETDRKENFDGHLKAMWKGWTDYTLSTACKFVAWQTNKRISLFTKNTAEKLDEYFSDPENKNSIEILTGLYDAAVTGLKKERSLEAAKSYREALKNGYDHPALLNDLVYEVAKNMSAECLRIEQNTGQKLPQKLADRFTRR